MKRAYSFCAVALGWALLVFLHVYKISALPGLHFDEAWAYNFSWRIASAPGFWPWNAMSPYTSPWAHYWAALWLHFLGPSLAVYRGSQISLALGGLVLLCFSLPRPVRAAFPFACLLLPGLILNHRFAIELTGLHVFCFGLLCWSLRREKWLLACVAALIGTTAHILFYAVALGLLGAVCLEGFALTKRARAGAMVYFAATGVFFLQVLLTIPERGKAAALVLSAFGSMGFLAIHGDGWGIWRGKEWKRALLVPAAVFTLICLFFAQGLWSAALMSGFAAPLNWWVVIGGMAILVVALAPGVRQAPTYWRSFYSLTVTCCGVLMLKPAPRYFELPFLLLSVMACWELSTWLFESDWWVLNIVRFRFVRASTAATVTIVLAGLVRMAYVKRYPIFLQEAPQHFLFFRDSSRDFLDKQSLVRYLGSSGCARGDIETHDPRLKEELDALALGNWPVQQANCPYMYVALRTEQGATGEAHGEFLLKKR